MNQRVSPFSALLQYLGKTMDESVHNIYSTKQGTLKEKFIEYNGNKYFSITAFVQAVFSEIHNSTIQVRFKHLTNTYIHGIKFPTILHALSRTPKSFIVEYKDNTIEYTSTTLQLDTNNENTFILPHFDLQIYPLEEAVQFQFSSSQDTSLNVHIQGDGYELKCCFSIKQNGVAVCQIPLDSSRTHSTATMLIKEKVNSKPKSNYFKIVYDETSHHLIVFSYPKELIWGKGTVQTNYI